MSINFTVILFCSYNFKGKTGGPIPETDILDEQEGPFRRTDISQLFCYLKFPDVSSPKLTLVVGVASSELTFIVARLAQRIISNMVVIRICLQVSKFRIAGPDTPPDV